MNSVIAIDPIDIRVNEASHLQTIPPAPNPGTTAAPTSSAIQWSWACRDLESTPEVRLEDPRPAKPSPGDLGLVRVEKVGFHKYLTTADNRRMRLYPGALFVGVFGNRYASDAYEAKVEGTDNLSMLTGAGMIGTVKSKHDIMAEPTRVALVGMVREDDGTRLNLKRRLFRPTEVRQLPRNLIYIVGTGMNSGKTTTAARLIKALSDLRLNVAACKLTGSVSNHDPDELASAAARRVTDFSDFGFPSTYLCSKEELLELFHAMLADVATGAPDVVLMELADGILQRETAMLLAEPVLREAGRGLVLTAESSLAGLWGAEQLRRLGYRLVAVSGKFTSSPLAIREYCENDSDIPVVSSAGTGAELAIRVRDFLNGD